MAEFDDDDMDNDNAFGRYCCMHRRWYCLLLSIGFLLYGMMNGLYFAIYTYVHMFTLSPSTCTGPGCGDILTCAATKNSSYEFRLSVMTIGSLVFGVVGIVACSQRYANEMFAFFGWLVTTIMVYMSVLVMDGAYIFICGNTYPTNTVEEAVLWPIPRWPVNRGVKYEIRQLESYPVNYVNEIVHHNVGVWFMCLTFAKCFFFAILAYQCFILAQRFHYGSAGMGINFNIENWMKKLKMKYEVNEVAYNTFDMAMATSMDLGWTEDEYMLQRPLRTPHWYRRPGMPAAAAQAYDGFRDDRRNVLL